MSDRIKKSVAAITTVMTALTMTGIVMLAPVSVGAVTIVDGDLIQNPNASGLAKYDVYIAKIVGNKTFKRLILSPHVFDSYGHLSWGSIKSVDQATLDSYTTSDLVRCMDPDFGVDDPKVYKMVADGDTGTKQHVNMTPAEFEAAGYDWDSIYIINKTDRDAYTTGSAITAEGGETPTTSTGTMLTVSLAADTPAAGIVVSNAARYPFTKVNLTASSDGDIVVDHVVVERTGIGNDGAFSSLDLVDATTDLPINTNSKSLNSVHRATFTKDFTVSAGTTRSVYLTGNMGSLSSYAGESPALSLVEVKLKGSATVNGSLPIGGNTMTTNSTVTIGSATVARGAYVNATSTSIQVGKEAYTYFSFKITAGSAEKIQFKQVKVYQEGSAGLSTDMDNIALYEDGTKLADGTTDGKYVTFSFSPVTLDKGQVKQFQVKADVIDGSARTIDLGIYRDTDLLVKGLTYGYNITPTYSSTGSSASNPRMSDNQFTISNGTLQVTRSNTVGAGNISVADDQVLGSFEFVCKGEPIDISAIELTVASSGTGSQIEDALTGLELIDADGNTVAGPSDITNDALTVDWTDTFTVPVGTSIYKVKGDLATGGGWSTDDTITVSFTPSAMTAEGTVTGNTITASPSSSLSANAQTVKAGSLIITRDTLPADQTIIANQNDLLLSSWTFDASNSGEDIRITSIGFTAKAGGNAATNTDNLTLYVDGVAKSPINDAVSDPTSTAQSSTFTVDDPIIIKSGEKATIELKGDKSSVDSNATENWGLRGNCVSAYGVGTGNEITEDITADDGPTLTTAAKGTLTIDTEGNPASAIVLAGTTGNVFSHIKLSARYEDIKLNELTLGVYDGGYEFSTAADTGNEYKDVTNVAIYDGTTKLAESNIAQASGHTFYFNTATSPELIIPKSSSKTLTVKVDMATVDPTGTDNAPGTNSSDIKVYVVGNAGGIKSTGTASNSEITGSSYETYNDATSSYMILRSAKPIVEYSTTGNPLGAATALTNGAVNLFNFKVTADSSGGSVWLYRATLVFNTTTSGGMTLTNTYIKDAQGNTLKAQTNPTTYDNTESYLTATFNNPDFAVWSNAADEVIEIASGESKTFYVWGTVSGAGTGENISTFLVGDTASTSNEVNTVNQANGTSSSVSGTAVANRGWKVPAGDLTTQVSNFIWSDHYDLDISKTGTGTSRATTTAFWYNGHLVPGLQNSVTTTAYVVGWAQ